MSLHQRQSADVGQRDPTLRRLLETLRMSSHPVMVFFQSVHTDSNTMHTCLTQWFETLWSKDKTVGYHAPREASLEKLFSADFQVVSQQRLSSCDCHKDFMRICLLAILSRTRKKSSRGISFTSDNFLQSLPQWRQLTLQRSVHSQNNCLRGCSLRMLLLISLASSRAIFFLKPNSMWVQKYEKRMRIWELFSIFATGN